MDVNVWIVRSVDNGGVDYLDDVVDLVGWRQSNYHLTPVIFLIQHGSLHRHLIIHFLPPVILNPSSSLLKTQTELS